MEEIEKQTKDTKMQPFVQKVITFLNGAQARKSV